MIAAFDIEILTIQNTFQPFFFLIRFRQGNIDFFLQRFGTQSGGMIGGDVQCLLDPLVELMQQRVFQSPFGRFKQGVGVFVRAGFSRHASKQGCVCRDLIDFRDIVVVKVQRTELVR